MLNKDIRIAVPDENTSEFLDFARGKEIGVEISSFAYPDVLDRKKEKNLKRFSEASKYLEGEISLHGPFMDLSPASPDSRIRKITKDRYLEILEIARKLNVDTVVLHSCYQPLIKHPVYENNWLSRQIKIWQKVVSAAESQNTVIALENQWQERPERSRDLIDEIDSPCFKACLDTGHVNLFSTVDVHAWLKTLKDRITYIHFHSNNGELDDHISPGRGNQDFSDFFKHLETFENFPTLTIEVNTLEDAEKSYTYLEDKLV